MLGRRRGGAVSAATAGTRFGLVLPHFGRDSSLDSVLRVARAAEAYGFSSLWVRDRLGAAAPHGLLLEAGGTRFLEPMLTLAAVAAATDSIHLGTAVLTPVRSPVKLLQDVGTLWEMSRGRVELGVGLGVSSGDLAATGMPDADRKELFEEYMRVLLSGVRNGAASFSGRYFAVDSFVVDPKPAPEMPIWYGGTSQAAVRRAFEFADGWIAGRLPVDTFRKRMQTVARCRHEFQRDIRVGTMPITVVGDDRARARAAVSDVVATLAASAEGSSAWVRPPSGSFQTLEDLSGLLIAGNSDDCVEEVLKLQAVGIDELIFDLRVVFDRVDEAVAVLGEEVLPVLRKDLVSATNT
jgi:alkanesulfonate monooxygenase SsuD/methylene tetrahydromethanopterin reductase-like flavin-dependent oxidoreductase (luciferase family)